MLFNFTKIYQISTTLTLKTRTLEMITEMKILGAIVTYVLKWHKNTNHVTRKAWARMQLLR